MKKSVFSVLKINSRYLHSPGLNTFLHEGVPDVLKMRKLFSITCFALHEIKSSALSADLKFDGES